MASVISFLLSKLRCPRNIICKSNCAMCSDNKSENAYYAESEDNKNCNCEHLTLDSNDQKKKIKSRQKRGEKKIFTMLLLRLVLVILVLCLVMINPVGEKATLVLSPSIVMGEKESKERIFFLRPMKVDFLLVEQKKCNWFFCEEILLDRINFLL